MRGYTQVHNNAIVFAKATSRATFSIGAKINVSTGVFVILHTYECGADASGGIPKAQLRKMDLA